MTNFKIGERQTFEFIIDSESGEAEEILDYVYLPVNAVREIYQ